MKKLSILFVLLVGTLGLFTGCEKEGEKVTMSTNVVPPSIKTMPDLTLIRSNALNTIVFEGTVVDPGFQASANYTLEACASGTEFASITTVASGTTPTFTLTIGDVNGVLKKKFLPYEEANVDFRIRATLVVDAGTNAPGTSADPFDYFSEIKTASVTTYGLPRLTLVGSGTDQYIESGLGDGVYEGFVKLDPAMSFTLTDPESSKSYGVSGSAIVENGSAITPPTNAGYHILDVDLNTGTFGFTEYQIGLVGSATPNGWGAPDLKMDYDILEGYWYIETDLVAGEVKFRKNDGWAWNLGGAEDNLTQGGANIPIPASGRYRVTLTIINDATGRCTIVPM